SAPSSGTERRDMDRSLQRELGGELEEEGEGGARVPGAQGVLALEHRLEGIEEEEVHPGGVGPAVAPFGAVELEGLGAQDRLERPSLGRVQGQSPGGEGGLGGEVAGEDAARGELAAQP